MQKAIIKFIITLLIIAITALSIYLLISPYSEVRVKSEPKTYVIEHAPDEKVFEIVHDTIIAGRERKNRLNALRWESALEDEEELREDMKKSMHWSEFIGGELTTGYDIIRKERGDFAEKIEPRRHTVKARAARARGFY